MFGSANRNPEAERETGTRALLLRRKRIRLPPLFVARQPIFGPPFDRLRATSCSFRGSREKPLRRRRKDADFASGTTIERSAKRLRSPGGWSASARPWVNLTRERAAARVTTAFLPHEADGHRAAGEHPRRREGPRGLPAAAWTRDNRPRARRLHGSRPRAAPLLDVANVGEGRLPGRPERAATRRRSRSLRAPRSSPLLAEKVETPERHHAALAAGVRPLPRATTSAKPEILETRDLAPVPSSRSCAFLAEVTRRGTLSVREARIALPRRSGRSPRGSSAISTRRAVRLGGTRSIRSGQRRFALMGHRATPGSGR